jgi:predicted unusual protein kinase regulating ubiquinone biosynthesis (AarF/ABC1/UbiB family)/nucleotide-binding universal stress UspA family protein
LSWRRSPDIAENRSHEVAPAGRIAAVVVTKILAVPDPSGRAVTWAREAADRFEAELAVFAVDPEEPDPAAAIVREAGQRGSDLIVLSDAGMRDRTEFLLANVANRVSHAARCSVVFVSDGALPSARTEPRERLLWRVAQIGRVFARHGLRDDRPAADRARRLREALEELGPTFAKLGQVLSTRPDLLPPEFITELARLQDDMPPLTRAEVVAVIETELGVPWEDALEHIEPEPLAAGTIAQVHRARLPGGSRVVLKVQRPSAEHQILEDLALLQLFADKVGNRPAFGRVVDLPAVFAYLSESLRRELDFSIEAASIERLRPVLDGYDRLNAPRVYPELSTRRLLVMEEVAGVSVSEAAPEEARHEAARQLLSCYYQQVLGEGFFHADPHPGNLRWANGEVWFLDFGMVGELDPDIRLLLLLLVMAFWRDDAPFLAETLLMLSGPDVPAGLDMDALELDLQELLGYVRGSSLAEIELGQVLTGIARIAARHGVRMPASLALAGKALAQVQVTAAQLDPDLQPVELIGRFVASSLTRDLTRHGDPRVALYELQKLRVRVRGLLDGFERVTGARPGPGLQVELRGLTEVERLVRRLTYLIAAASMAAAIAFVIALVLWATG